MSTVSEPTQTSPAQDSPAQDSTEQAPAFVESLNPATDASVARFAVDGPAAVDAAVARAHEAAPWWQEQGFAGRRRHLLRWASWMAAHRDEAVDLLHRENGKPRPDATIELLMTLEHLDWAAKHAAKVLADQSHRPGLLLANFSATTSFVPYGVVGVIGPWNYPMYTPSGSIALALAAGNTVVFKPSEHTPAVGDWYVKAFAAANPDAPEGVLSVVHGFGPTGAALAASAVNKVAFTGSTATGRRVMMAAAQNLTPVVMELGGKDAALVAADADVPAAADAIAWGAMGNSGQTCVGVERVYVHRSVRDQLVAELQKALAQVRPGSEDGASYGPMTMPAQVDVVRSHVADALERGGTAVVGGLDSVGERYISPVVILDAPEDSLAVREETFGPTLTVTTVDDMDEAVRLANDSQYGLGGAVFSQARGAELARRLDTGVVSVNSVIGFAGIPSLPLGGTGASGFGRIHGPEGLREFSRTKGIASQRFPLPGVKLLSFGRAKAITALLPRVIGLRHVRRS
ncbi:aldehyde dehydrogenase family protein [Rhodococcus sp. X156]|uniref:aldehyde dehydrogenase family protein n=1 Tax=Rhodococcus sp. X156 TaxID=2499145 RepID=UPI000FDC524B|nr:aldehyde dehydrogenase family protein [Rhodococcus sp. X156]